MDIRYLILLIKQIIDEKHIEEHLASGIASAKFVGSDDDSAGANIPKKTDGDYAGLKTTNTTLSSTNFSSESLNNLLDKITEILKTDTTLADELKKYEITEETISTMREEIPHFKPKLSDLTKDEFQKNLQSAFSNLHNTSELDDQSYYRAVRDSLFSTRFYSCNVEQNFMTFSFKAPTSPESTNSNINDNTLAHSPSIVSKIMHGRSEEDNDKLHVAVDDCSFENLARGFRHIYEFMDNFAEREKQAHVHLFKFILPRNIHAFISEQGQIGKFCTIYTKGLGVDKILQLSQELNARLKEHGIIAGTLASDYPNIQNRNDISLRTGAPKETEYTSYSKKGKHAEALSKITKEKLSSQPSRAVTASAAAASQTEEHKTEKQQQQQQQQPQQRSSSSFFGNQHASSDAQEDEQTGEQPAPKQ